MAINIRSILLGELYIQSGNGIPIHLSPKGSVFVDLDGPNEYLSYGDGTWVGSGGSSGDTYTTGLTFNPSNYNLTLSQNNGVAALVTNLGIIGVDVTGGTYNPSTGCSTFTTNSGGSFTVCGFLTGHTDTYVTGMTFTNNLLTLYQTQGNTTVSQLINTLTGLTVNGTLNVTTLSAVTYNNLPITSSSVTGFTNNNNLFTVSNSTGGTISTLFNTISGLTVNGTLNTTTLSAVTYQNLPITSSSVTGFTNNNNLFTVSNSTGGTVSTLVTTISGLTVNGTLNVTTLSAVTYNNLPLDIRVTGGSYNNPTGTATFTNNTGGTFTVTGFLTGATGTDTYVTGFTYSNNQLLINQNLGQSPLGVIVNTMSGLTVNGTLNVTTLSAMTYQNLPITSSSVTGFTNNNNLFTVSNSTGGTVSTLFNTISGLTVNGTLNVTTLSAVTYQNLPITSSSVTGFTNNNNLFTVSNSTGGTISTLFNTISGLTVNGTLNVTTLSAVTYNNLPLDVRVTGGTYSSGTATFTNNTGGTFNVTGFGVVTSSVTGLTNNNNLLTISNSTGGTVSTLFKTVTGFTDTGDMNISGYTYITGKVGIGTTSPTEYLTINGTVNQSARLFPTLGGKYQDVQTYDIPAGNPLDVTLNILNFNIATTGSTGTNGNIFGRVKLVFSCQDTPNGNPFSYMREYNIQVGKWAHDTGNPAYNMTSVIDSQNETGTLTYNVITLGQQLADAGTVATDHSLTLATRINAPTAGSLNGGKLTVSYDLTSNAVSTANFIIPSFASAYTTTLTSASALTSTLSYLNNGSGYITNFSANTISASTLSVGVPNSTGSTTIQMTRTGTLFGNSIHNSTAINNSTTNQYICSGTYIPTYSTNTNCIAGGGVNGTAKWIRVGNVVSVAGTVTAGSSVASQIIFILTVPLNLTTAVSTGYEMNGTISSGAGSGFQGHVAANTTSQIKFTAWTTATGLVVWGYNYSYELK